MALLNCPDCKTKVSETAKSCPKCGFSLTPEAVKKIKGNSEASRAGGCVVLLVALVGYGIWKLMSPATPIEAPPSAPPPLTEAQKAEAAARAAQYDKDQALLISNLAKASTSQVRTIFTKCRAMVDDIAAKQKVMSAMVADESSPDSYQTLAVVSGGSYRSIDERVAKFLKDKRNKDSHLDIDMDLGFTIISMEATFTASQLVPHSYRCSLSSDLSVMPPTG